MGLESETSYSRQGFGFWGCCFQLGLTTYSSIGFIIHLLSTIDIPAWFRDFPTGTSFFPWWFPVVLRSQDPPEGPHGPQSALLVFLSGVSWRLNAKAFLFLKHASICSDNGAMVLLQSPRICWQVENNKLLDFHWYVRSSPQQRWLNIIANGKVDPRFSDLNSKLPRDDVAQFIPNMFDKLLEHRYV